MMLVWFVLWFAWVDLFGRRSLRVTLVNLVGVLALVGFALLVYGLILGTKERRLESFRNDPLATCLVMRSPGGATPLAPADMAALEQAVRAALASPDRLRAIAPISDFTWEWWRPGEPSAPAFQGRSLAPNDPMFNSYRDPAHWLAGGPLAPGQAGVVIGEPMLEKLGLKREALPSQLDVETLPGKVPVALVGVLKGEVPGRYHFILPEAVYLEITRKDFNPRVPEISSGPLTPRWAAINDFPAEVEKYYRKYGIIWEGEHERRDGARVWRFRQTDPQPPWLATWKNHLTNIALELKQAHGEAAEGFVVPTPVGKVAEAPPPAGPTRVALYLTDLTDLGPAVAAARGKNYEPTDDRYDQIHRIQQTTSRALELLTILLVAVAVLVAWNLYAIQKLQAEHQVAEIGMLKAMGLPGGTLVAIYLCKAMMLWAPAAVLGLGAGWGLGRLSEWWMSRDDAQSTLAFTVPAIPLAIVLGGSLFLCLASTWWASRRPRRRSPLECLSDA